MTSRRRVLEHLRHHPGSAAGEIARALRQTAANARHHLRELERDGLIVPVSGTVAAGQRTAGGSRGRPQKAYSLSPRAQGDNVALLAETLLESMLADASPAEREARIRDLAARIGASPSWGAANALGALPRRLNALVEGLAGLHYQPRWEARASGPHVILGHCPFAEIIARHPELCRVDAHLLAERLGSPVEQVAKLEPNEKGLPVCVFAMKSV
jgi:predicted ArsR family transcriptional regulator